MDRGTPRRDARGVYSARSGPTGVRGLDVLSNEGITDKPHAQRFYPTCCGFPPLGVPSDTCSPMTREKPNKKVSGGSSPTGHLSQTEHPPHVDRTDPDRPAPPPGPRRQLPAVNFPTSTPWALLGPRGDTTPYRRAVPYRRTVPPRSAAAAAAPTAATSAAGRAATARGTTAARGAAAAPAGRTPVVAAGPPAVPARTAPLVAPPRTRPDGRLRLLHRPHHHDRDEHPDQSDHGDCFDELVHRPHAFLPPKRGPPLPHARTRVLRFLRDRGIPPPPNGQSRLEQLQSLSAGWPP